MRLQFEDLIHHSLLKVFFFGSTLVCIVEFSRLIHSENIEYGELISKGLSTCHYLSCMLFFDRLRVIQALGFCGFLTAVICIALFGKEDRL